MLFFKFLTALLVPLAASASTMPTGSKPVMPNNTAFNATISEGVPPIVSGTVSGLPSSSAGTYQPSASNSSRDNTTFKSTARRALSTGVGAQGFKWPCNCIDKTTNCNRVCQYLCD
ncbi:hypothetical protein BGW80DRAFT_548760 [Lactifluus volemus]|nr:hypothetical protein BGW80DRAFT_548760 [Lactifluus volemus]